MIRQVRLNAALLSCLLLLLCIRLAAQGVAVPGDKCKPASARTQEIGCWILADQPVGQLRKATSVLASRYVSNTHRGASRQGAAGRSCRIVWQSVVDDHRGRELEICPRESHCRDWTASSHRRRKVLGGSLMGGGLHTRNDGARTHPLRPRGLVRGERRNMPGDLRWSHADQPRRRPSGCRSHGIINAPHRYWLRAASLDRDHSPSVIAAPDHNGP